MSKGLRLFAAAWITIVLGCLIAYFTQSSGGVEIKDVRFMGTDRQQMSALLYIPEGASAENPAPGILAVHGYINSREVQSGFAIEFARRGYVVLAIDQSGHGYSEGAMGANGFGGPSGLRYLRSLDFVDTDNIGLEGHSMGGWTVLAAAATYPDDYKAVVLEGSSTGAPFAREGDATWPRNLAVVYPKYDEFSSLMWGVSRAQDAASGDKLKQQFGTDATVVEGQLYGDIAAGTARILHQPPVTHPGAHLSRAAIGDAISWFDRTLDGAEPIPADQQIWYWKEVGTLMALVGCVLLILSTFELLLHLPMFAPLRSTPAQTAYSQRSAKWWLLFLVSTIVPVITFYPLMDLAAKLLPASALLPQAITTQVVVWALVNALIMLVVGRLLKGREVNFAPLQWLRSVGIAMATIAVAMIALNLADYFFMVDFRFWFVGLKILSATQFGYALIYFVPFFIYFALTTRGLHQGLSVESDRPARQYLGNALALMGGILVFLLVQYIVLFATGKLLTPTQPLNTIVFIQFVPILLLAAVFSTFAYRRTNHWLPGALICALFVSWYVVAGQAMQYPV